MNITLTCKICDKTWTVHNEPRGLLALACPQCDTQSEARAAEDLASSLEDALCQLWLLGKTVAIHIDMSSAAIPPAFKPSE